MKRFSPMIALIAAALWLAACGAPAGNTGTNNAASNSNTNANAAKPTAAAPSKETLMALEKSGWEAWKNRDPKWVEDNYTEKGFNLVGKGRMDKTAMIKATTTQKCDIKSYSLSDDKMTMAGADMAILTFKGTQDGTCDGKKVPAAVWSASIYVREGDKWKAAFYAEAPAKDANAPAEKPAAAAPAAKEETKPAAPAPDPATQALIDVETKAWDAWKNKDAAGLDAFAAKNMVSLIDSGWSERAATLKYWGDPACDIKSTSLTDGAATAFGEASILTFLATVDGKCGGQSVPAERGATVYVKEDGVWKALLTMGIPAA